MYSLAESAESAQVPRNPSLSDKPLGLRRGLSSELVGTERARAVLCLGSPWNSNWFAEFNNWQIRAGDVGSSMHDATTSSPSGGTN